MFTEIPASNRSINNRKPVQGVGTNDATYCIQYTDTTGKTFKCPYYVVWAGMLGRCYGNNIKPTYQDVTVCEEWLTFSTFKAWMKHQDWIGKVLDKDLLSGKHKQYNPQNCLFITPQLNNLLTLRQNHRGSLPLGVSQTVIKGNHYYIASCSFYGKQKRLGYFKNISEAHQKYLEAKKEYIQQLAEYQTDSKVKAALFKLL